MANKIAVRIKATMTVEYNQVVKLSRKKYEDIKKDLEKDPEAPYRTFTSHIDQTEWETSEIEVDSVEME